MNLVINGRLITRDTEGKGYYEHGAVAYEGSKIVEVGDVPGGPHGGHHIGHHAYRQNHHQNGAETDLFSFCQMLSSSQPMARTPCQLLPPVREMASSTWAFTLPTGI